MRDWMDGWVGGCMCDLRDRWFGWWMDGLVDG